MEPVGASADGALDAPPAAPEQQTELGARLQELVRQAEAQAQQVRGARELRPARGPDPRARAASAGARGPNTRRAGGRAAAHRAPLQKRAGCAPQGRGVGARGCRRAGARARTTCAAGRGGAYSARLAAACRAGCPRCRSRASACSDPRISPRQLRLRCAETKETDALRTSLEAELAAVEEDVKRVEQELSAARSEARGYASGCPRPPLRRSRARAGQESARGARKD